MSSSVLYQSFSSAATLPVGGFPVLPSQMVERVAPVAGSTSESAAQAQAAAYDAAWQQNRNSVLYRDDVVVSSSSYAEVQASSSDIEEESKGTNVSNSGTVHQAPTYNPQLFSVLDQMARFSEVRFLPSNARPSTESVSPSTDITTPVGRAFDVLPAVDVSMPESMLETEGVRDTSVDVEDAGSDVSLIEPHLLTVVADSRTGSAYPWTLIGTLVGAYTHDVSGNAGSAGRLPTGNTNGGAQLQQVRPVTWVDA
jgi:hypothetical protein